MKRGYRPINDLESRYEAHLIHYGCNPPSDPKVAKKRLGTAWKKTKLQVAVKLPDELMGSGIVVAGGGQDRTPKRKRGSDEDGIGEPASKKMTRESATHNGKQAIPYSGPVPRSGHVEESPGEDQDDGSSSDREETPEPLILSSQYEVTDSEIDHELRVDIYEGTRRDVWWVNIVAYKFEEMIHFVAKMDRGPDEDRLNEPIPLTWRAHSMMCPDLEEKESGPGCSGEVTFSEFGGLDLELHRVPWIGPIWLKIEATRMDGPSRTGDLQQSWDRMRKGKRYKPGNFGHDFGYQCALWNRRRHDRCSFHPEVVTCPEIDLGSEHTRLDETRKLELTILSSTPFFSISHFTGSPSSDAKLKKCTCCVPLVDSTLNTTPTTHTAPR